MSLVSDPNFLMHSLRLAYLRRVEDPYAARIITLDPSYQGNRYILSSSLADPERWPELNWPDSPDLSEDEQETSKLGPSPRVRLNQIREERRARSASRATNVARPTTPAPPAQQQDQPAEPDIKNFVSGHAPVTEALSTSVHTVHVPQQFNGIAWTEEKSGEEKKSSPEPVVHIQQATPVVAPKVIQFVPKFKGAAEMEARRRIRMAARRGPGAPPPPPMPVKPLTFDSSSEEEEEVVVESAVSDDYEHVGNVPAHDISDEFDPVIITPGVEMSPRPNAEPVQKPTQLPNKALNSKSARSNSNASTASTHELTFSKRKVTPIKPIKSALTAKLSTGSTRNPFTELYGGIGQKAGPTSTRLRIYFPLARHPLGDALTIDVRRDATVEEVIGFALWKYWEQGWMPKLDDGLAGPDDPKWATRISTVGWVLRITEDDGEVDDDCPAPDRSRKAADFSDVYAVLEATPLQVTQNQIMESQILRRPTKSPLFKGDKPLPSNSSLAPNQIASTLIGSMMGSMLSTSLGPSSSHGPQLFLRIHTADDVQIRTTVQVSSGMYLQEVLELVCQKRKIANSNDYALLLVDKSMMVPLDRTVASLQGQGDLALVRRDMLPKNAVVLNKLGKTTDPNASIFKRMSETPEQKSSALLDFAAVYKKYTVYRRIPMLVARQERTLAIDGDYVHIMPPNKARARVVFESSGKTVSYHLKSISSCQQSSKASATFKLILSRTSGNKRYDFEADSPKIAAEIVQTIKTLKSAVERSGTLQRSRRSRIKLS